MTQIHGVQVINLFACRYAYCFSCWQNYELWRETLFRTLQILRKLTRLVAIKYYLVCGAKVGPGLGKL